MPDALRFLILTAAGWVNRHQEDVIDSLREEIVDEIFLVAIHPASQGQHEEVQGASAINCCYPALISF